MKKRILILVLALLPVCLCIWYLSPLFTSNLHIIDDFTGRLCPCSFSGEIESENDGSFRLQVHDGAGETIWVNPATICEGALSIEAYVLPWFGRQRVEIQQNGTARFTPGN